MTGEVENLKRILLSYVVGVNKDGQIGLQGTGKSTALCGVYGDSLHDQMHLDVGNLNRAVYNDLAVAIAFSGQRTRPVINRALSGTRSDQILQSIIADIDSGALDASGAGLVFLSMGTNDLPLIPFTDVVSGNAITSANVVDNLLKNLATAVDKLRTLGIQTIFRNLHGSSAYGATQIAYMEIANARMRQLHRPYAHLFDARKCLRNPITTTSSTIAFRTNYMKQDAGPVFVHEAVPGAMAAAKDLAEIIKFVCPPAPQIYVDGASIKTAGQRVNLIQNPQFAIGAGGTAGINNTGGALGTDPSGNALAAVPDYWTLQRLSGDTTSTWTVNVKEDNESRFVQLVIAGAAGGGVRLFQGLLNTDWDTGDIVQGFSKIEIVSGAVNLACACPYAEVQLDGASKTTTGLYNTTTQGVFPSTEGYIIEDATEQYTVPGYTTKNFMAFRAAHILFATAGTATVNIRFPRLETTQPTQALAA